MIPMMRKGREILGIAVCAVRKRKGTQDSVTTTLLARKRVRLKHGTRHTFFFGVREAVVFDGIPVEYL